MFEQSNRTPDWWKEANESRDIKLDITVHDTANEPFFDYFQVLEVGEQIAQSIDKYAKYGDSFFELKDWDIGGPETPEDDYVFTVDCTIFACVKRWTEKIDGYPLQMGETDGGFLSADKGNTEEEAKLEIYQFLKDALEDTAYVITAIDNGKIELPKEKEELER